MQTKVQKWGNSLALRIPKSFAAETSLKEDSLVDLSLENGRLVIEAVKPKFTLDELLDQITEETLHEEIDFGPPVGKEAW